MGSRAVRGTVAATLLVVVVVAAPPAPAASAFELEFVAGFTLGGPGHGYPCFGAEPGPSGTPGLDLSLCPQPTPLAVTLPLPNDPAPNGHLEVHHDANGAQPLSIDSILCVGGGGTVLKSHIAGVGLCTFGLDGYVEGHCALRGGRVTGTVTTTNTAPGALPLTYVVDIHFNDIAKVWLFNGHFRNLNTGQHGKIVGQGLLDPPPLPLGPLGPGNTCLRLSARGFLLVGQATGVSNPLL